MLIQKHSLEIFADYGEIALVDCSPEAWGSVEFPAWTAANHATRVVAGDGVLALATARNVTVPFELEIYDSAPHLDIDLFDHVVECGLTLRSGRIVVAGFDESDFESFLPTGTYQAIVTFSGLSTVDFGDDGELVGEDLYRIALWRGIDRPLRVVRQWVNGLTGAHAKR